MIVFLEIAYFLVLLDPPKEHIIFWEWSHGTYLTHRRAVIVNHSSMFVVLLLQWGLHAVVAVLHALGKALLDLPVMKLHFILPLQLSVETINILCADLSSVQQLDERDRVNNYAYYPIITSPNYTSDSQTWSAVL